MELTLRSSAFRTGEKIPKEFTGEGRNESPPLEWDGIPEGTKEFALLCEDPDAPSPQPWVHWLLYKVPADLRKLPEALPANPHLELLEESLQGKNSFGNFGYGGPMPPPGHGPHRYIFRLYALDMEINLEPEATKGEFLQAIEGRVLATSELIGTYERQKARKAG